jgi:hypothetical protein
MVNYCFIYDIIKVILRVNSRLESIFKNNISRINIEVQTGIKLWRAYDYTQN